MTRKKIDSHTLQVLEFDQVREILARFAGSSLGREAALRLYPSVDEDWIKRRLAETSEMKGLLEREIRVPMAGLRDIKGLLEHYGEKQTVFEPNELLEISDTLAASGRLNEFFSKLPAELARHLQAMGEKLHNFDDTVAEISRCIENDKTVRDDASARLQEIRKYIGKLYGEIQHKIKAIISSPDMQKAVENENILTRHGRAVIAVKANYRQRLQGMVLDRSNSGGTLYIEPYALAELSNQLEDALSDEKREVWRILWTLTKLVLDQQKEILRSIEFLEKIDLTYAKARFSQEYALAAPIAGAGTLLRLRQARHPLLLEWDCRKNNVSVSDACARIVPIDVRLGDDFDLLLITGPNTGGKTVTLKTVGLLILMAQSGMHIPAWPDSQLPVYRQIFADIGDEQSIQQSLSTFSSHISQIVKILERANKKSLVLLDELGAGTDPSEGAALGMAILDQLRIRGAQLIATTHLGKLKGYAYTTPRVENASVQFDVETLEPTFRLLTGTPGSSNALAITQRLGMVKAIIKQAEAILAAETDGSSELINQVQQTREKAEQNRARTQAMMDQIRAMQQVATERMERVNQERAQLTEQADREIDKTMRQVRDIVARFMGQMNNAPKPWREWAESLREKISTVAADTTLARRQAEFIAKLRKGDTVYIIPFKCEGVVQRIHRKRQMAVLLFDGKEFDVPFSDVWETNDRQR